jgi:AAA15 family ATPase/GTPase
MKKELLALLTKSDFGHINDFVIKKGEISASIVEHLSDEVKSKIKNSDRRYIAKEIFLSHNYGDNYMLPIRSESRGTQRFLELTGPLIDVIKNNKFLCIDEIESSLHQELLEFFIKHFSKIALVHKYSLPPIIRTCLIRSYCGMMKSGLLKKVKMGEVNIPA